MNKIVVKLIWTPKFVVFRILLLMCCLIIHWSVPNGCPETLSDSRTWLPSMCRKEVIPPWKRKYSKYSRIRSSISLSLDIALPRKRETCNSHRSTRSPRDMVSQEQLQTVLVRSFDMFSYSEGLLEVLTKPVITNYSLTMPISAYVNRCMEQAANEYLERIL